MKNLRKIITLTLVVCLLSIFISGCGKKEESTTVKIGVVNWADCIAISNLTKVILEDRLGYDVELTMGDVGPVYASVANGDYDAYLDGWVPTTHKSFMEKFEGELNEYSTIFEGTLCGLVVPSYVEINSIEELNDAKDQFDGKIVGIDSGAGIMGQTEDAINEYGLDYELQTGSGPVMTATLADAIASEEPIVVTGWQPHWMFGKWDLKFLDDPKKAYGEPEYIKSVIRLGFEDDFPEFAAFLKNFTLTGDQLSGLMSKINASDEDPEVVARAWVEDNKDVVDGWLKGIN